MKNANRLMRLRKGVEQEEREAQKGKKRKGRRFVACVPDTLSELIHLCSGVQYL